jgi:hypothetical protein
VVVVPVMPAVMMPVTIVPTVMMPAVMVPVAMMPTAMMMPPMPVMPPMAMVPAAVPHHVHGGHLIGCGADAAAEACRYGRRDLRRGEHERCSRQDHQNESAHVLSSGCGRPVGQKAPSRVNSA